jgi:hypothetical protein
MPRYLTAALFCLLFLHGLISERVFGSSWAATGEADSRINQFLFELTVCVTAALLLYKRRARLPAGSLWFALYVGWALLSGLLTRDTLFDGFMYCRYALYAFAVYAAVWNYPFTRVELDGLNRLITTLALIQIAATVVKLFVLHDRTEWRVGTMTIAGGGLAALFPLLALAYAMGYYFYVRRSCWLLLTGFSFAMIAYASGKRAIYFTLPVAALANILLYCWLEPFRKMPAFLPKFLVHVGLCGALLSPAMWYGIAHTEGIAFTAKGATASEILNHAFEYARGYEYGRASNGMIAGRSGAAERVTDSISEVPAETLLFGWGPTALMPKRGDALQGGGGFRPLGITYGIVGWSRDAISIGLPGALLYLVFIVTVMRAIYRRARRGNLGRVWKGLCFGTLAGFLVLLYDYLLYDVPLSVITFVLLFYAAVILSPVYRSRLAGQHDLYSGLRFRIVPSSPTYAGTAEQTKLF